MKILINLTFIGMMSAVAVGCTAPNALSTQSIDQMAVMP